MELKGPDAFSGIGDPDRNGSNVGGDNNTNALAKLFNSILNRVMDQAKENSNSGA